MTDSEINEAITQFCKEKRDYTTDANAMQFARTFLSNDQLNAYAGHYLWSDVSRSSFSELRPNYDYHDLAMVASATTTQQARAFVKAIA